MRFMQEEVFGPLAGIISYSDLTEAISLANDVEFGLAAGTLTQDHTETNKFVDELDFDVVKNQRSYFGA